MKNYEKYADEIREYKGENFCTDFIHKNILESGSCSNKNCQECRMLQMLWLLEDYKEPKVDWSKVAVDTPILVRDTVNAEWIRRHFAKYKNGDVYAWSDAYTSWTTSYTDDVTRWKYAKLAESEEER